MKKLSTLLLIAAVAAGIDANSAEVTRIAAGNHTILLTKDGKIYVSGNNDAGQLGDGHYYDSEVSDNHYNATTFKPVEKDGVKFRSVTATLYNSYAIASDGALYAWGQNAYGQLGLVSVGTYSGIYTPTKVDDAKWAVVKGRSTTIVGIHTDGTLWAWGKNLTGQLGVGADSEMKECATTPEKVSDERWLDCASGFYHSTAVKADGTARIVVTADNAKGYGLQSRVKTQVGVDQPMPAENVSLRVDGGEATLSWTAPTAGKNGGYVGNLTYRVERNDGVVVAEATTETSLTGLQKGKYSLTEYKVTAANESGTASAATSNSVILGDALAMPFKESFDGGQCQHTWFMGAAWDTFTAGNDPKTQDADGTGGLISFCCYSTNVAKGTVSTIVSPAIAVGGQQAYFNFSVYHYSGTFATEDSLTPCAIAADGSVQTLGDPIMRDNGTTGWKEYSYPLSGNVVCVALKGYSDYGYNIHVDRIAVSTEQSGVSAVEIADNALVTVYNLSGARVAERMQRSDVSTLAPGCYIVRSATATEKVIVR